MMMGTQWAYYLVASFSWMQAQQQVLPALAGSLFNTKL